MFGSLLLFSLLTAVNGHGRLIDPPSRSSAWRFGYGTPTNHDDNALYCGGVGIQYGRNGGKCGVCGDAYDAKVRDNEAGCKYARGVIVKAYKPGSTIPVVVDITTNHRGYFKFSICPNNNPRRAATEYCFQDVHIAGHGEKMFIGTTSGKITAHVRIPAGLTCTQCVFRWIYTAGNSWGTDATTGKSCLGCGNQEQFYGCADISISGSGGGNVVLPTIAPKPPTKAPNLIFKTTRIPLATVKVGPKSGCHSVMPFRSSAMDSWCKTMCSAGHCPKSHCRC